MLMTESLFRISPRPCSASSLVTKAISPNERLSNCSLRTVQLIAPIRKNMKNRLMGVTDKLLLRRRAIIETINDQLKNISQIEHTRHRSVHNFIVNMICGLIAYSRPKSHRST